MNFVVAIFAYSDWFNIVNIFFENCSIYWDVRKQRSRSQITHFRVSSSMHTIVGSDYFQIVSTKVVMKYFVIVIAPSLFDVLIADTKDGRHLQAYSRTLSFECYLMILHNKATVYQTYGLYNYFNLSIKTLSILMATSASSVSKVLIPFSRSSFYSSYFYSAFGLLTKFS